MNRTFERVVSEKMHGRRLDLYLMESGIGTSRNQAAKLIAQGLVLVNDKPTRPSYKVKSDDRITASFETAEPFSVDPEPIPLRIAYEDSEVVVVDKPAGMVVHPARGHSQHTLVNALLHHCRNLPAGANRRIRPGVLHRLDKDTTGLLVFAKTDESLTNMGRQVEARKFTREYRAVVWGDLGLETGTIDAPVGRSSLNRKRMAVTPFASRQAITRFETLERFGIATLVKVRLLTGRTHQIRVHMTHYGHPVVGDPEYGGRSREVVRRQTDVPAFECMLKLIKRQALHAAVLGFWHPKTGKYLEFSSPLPEDMELLLEFLRSGRARPAASQIPR
jgi:23S rRNA pseudouridine1911/1915/1917 synthase